MLIIIPISDNTKGQNQTLLQRNNLQKSLQKLQVIPSFNSTSCKGEFLLLTQWYSGSHMKPDKPGSPSAACTSSSPCCYSSFTSSFVAFHTLRFSYRFLHLSTIPHYLFLPSISSWAETGKHLIPCSYQSSFFNLSASNMYSLKHKQGLSADTNKSRRGKCFSGIFIFPNERWHKPQILLIKA